jgi:hypothetical protein
MAIAFDAVTDGYANSTSVSFAHTCTGSDRFLVVGIKLYGDNDITGVTYNGVAMSHIATALMLSEGNRAVLYGLTAPATGANNVVISRTSSNHIVATAASYTGVNQTGQPEASGTDADSGAAQTTPAATVVSADAWLVAVGVASFQGAGFEGKAGTTMRLDNNELLAGIQAAFDSNGVVATGSQSLGFGIVGTNADLAGVVAVLAPAGGGGGGTGNPWHAYAQQ